MSLALSAVITSHSRFPSCIWSWRRCRVSVFCSRLQRKRSRRRGLRIWEGSLLHHLETILITIVLTVKENHLYKRRFCKHNVEWLLRECCLDERVEERGKLMKKTGRLSWMSTVCLHPVRQRESWSRENKPNRDDKRSSNRKLRNCRWETKNRSRNQNCLRERLLVVSEILFIWLNWPVIWEQNLTRYSEVWLTLYFRTLSALPPQDMDRLITDLKRQLNEESAKIANVKSIVERTQKETSQAEELLRDQLEVGPTVYSNGVPPTYQAQRNRCFKIDPASECGHKLHLALCSIPVQNWRIHTSLSTV